MTPRHIAIEGPIGVGKTSLTRRLAVALGAECLFEGADENPFLPGYYADPARYALATQLHFLCQRTRQLQPVLQGDFFRSGLVADFMFEKDRLFASIALDQDEFRLYEDIFARFAPEVPVPDLVIYLSAPVSVLRARIAQRGIHYEQHIDDGYLTRLGGVYDDFFHGYRAAPVMFIDAVAVDLVGQPTHFEALLHAIRTGARQLDLPDPTGKDSDPRPGEARLAV